MAALYLHHATPKFDAYDSQSALILGQKFELSKNHSGKTDSFAGTT